MVAGVQLGNVWIGVQPALGVEGDPMRLLFERDLTPHPQYAAFYRVWLQQRFGAHAVLHFGMHGTVEWLPGAPLGAPSIHYTPGVKCVEAGGMLPGVGMHGVAGWAVAGRHITYACLPMGLKVLLEEADLAHHPVEPGCGRCFFSFRV